MPAIFQISDWPSAAVQEILAESEREGFCFVRRAAEEWTSGANRFSKEDEAFFGVFERDRLVALAGINRESEHRGRLRRFYVRREARRMGIGGQLLRHVLAFAARHYTEVVLRCDTGAADSFYCVQGFSRADSEGNITHWIQLRETPNQLPGPTSPSVTPPAWAGGAPFVAADH